MKKEIVIYFLKQIYYDNIKRKNYLKCKFRSYDNLCQNIEIYLK